MLLFAPDRLGLLKEKCFLLMHSPTLAHAPMHDMRSINWILTSVFIQSKKFPLSHI